jgi:CRISPR-associated protein Csm3
MRSLLEWQLGLVTVANGHPFSFQHLAKADSEQARNLLRLFGGAPGGEVEHLVREIGPTRLAFWDCPLSPGWLARAQARNLPATEAKSENAIDRNAGVAETPRFTERVIAGAEFDFRISLKVVDGEDLLPLLQRGLKLLAADSLGGSGSRGYGKIVLEGLTLDGESIQAEFDALDPFAA